MLPQASAEFENTHINTGNQIEDLIAVAMTQVGYTEKDNNDTKYCDWMGYPNQAWCAMFITWCADQAELPPSVMDPSAWAHPRNGRGFGVPYYHGTEYTPKRGDLFFKEDFSHVGIVYGIEGEYALTIEANTNDDGSAEGYAVMLRKRKISESYFGIPQYTNCSEDHDYSIKYESGHPHRRYYYCSTCKKAFYTGGYELVTSCKKCLDCKCLSVRQGYYTVKQASGRLRVYDSHKANYVIGYLDPGELIYVQATDYEWGHILYGSTPGCVKLSSLKRFVYAPTDFAPEVSACYETESVTLHWSASLLAKKYYLTVMQDGEAIMNIDAGSETSYTLTGLSAGQYQFQLRSNDNYAYSQVVSLDYTVLPTYTVTFDTSAGTQKKYHRQALILSDTAPSKDGYVFLGWYTEPNAGIAAYQPGDTFRLDQDTDLFAVWQREDAKAVSLQILTPASQTIVAADGTPDTAGLNLLLTYDDGTAVLISEGYDAQVSASAGSAQMVITYEGLRAAYDVTVLPCALFGCSEKLIEMQNFLY